MPQQGAFYLGQFYSGQVQLRPTLACPLDHPKCQVKKKRKNKKGREKETKGRDNQYSPCFGFRRAFMQHRRPPFGPPHILLFLLCAVFPAVCVAFVAAFHVCAAASLLLMLLLLYLCCCLYNLLLLVRLVVCAFSVVVAAFFVSACTVLLFLFCVLLLLLCAAGSPTVEKPTLAASDLLKMSRTILQLISLPLTSQKLNN